MREEIRLNCTRSPSTWAGILDNVHRAVVLGVLAAEDCGDETLKVLELCSRRRYTLRGTRRRMDIDARLAHDGDRQRQSSRSAHDAAFATLQASLVDFTCRPANLPHAFGLPRPGSHSPEYGGSLMSAEVWFPVVGWEESYEVSSRPPREIPGTHDHSGQRLAEQGPRADPDAHPRKGFTRPSSSRGDGKPHHRTIASLLREAQEAHTT